MSLLPLGGVGVIAFFLAGVFYFLASTTDPGYVRKELNILEVLQQSNENNVCLENFCFYC